MEKKTFFLPLFFLFFLSGCATSSMSYAKEKVKILKEGMLLVRLHNSEGKIAKLIELGQEEEARKTEAEQREKNKRIIQAFDESFDYCPVYYFYAGHSQKVRYRQLDGILMNKSLEIDSTLNLEDTPFLIAEFGEAGDSDVGLFLPGLVVMDYQFTPLSKPFPYFVRTTFMSTKKEAEKAVKTLNRKLHRLDKPSY